MCEGLKLAYADFLLRCGLLGFRAALLQFDFLEGQAGARTAAAGHLPIFVKSPKIGRVATEGIGK
jgi:hypothetical protein